MSGCSFFKASLAQRSLWWGPCCDSPGPSLPRLSGFASLAVNLGLTLGWEGGVCLILDGECDITGTSHFSFQRKEAETVQRRP